MTDAIAQIEAYFEAADDFVVISAKGNLEEYEIGVTPTPANLMLVYQYFHSMNIVASTHGVHCNGENKKPHWHYHAIFRLQNVPKTVFSNASKHRSDWLRKTKSDTTFGDVSFRVSHLSADKCRYATLTYPLKEGLAFSDSEFNCLNMYDGASMCFKPRMYEALKAVGQQLYDQAMAVNLRRDKSQAKAMSIRDAVSECIGENIFYSFKDVLRHVADNYYRKLPPNELPDWCNVRKAAVNICVYRNMPIDFDELR